METSAISSSVRAIPSTLATPLAAGANAPVQGRETGISWDAITTRVARLAEAAGRSPNNPASQISHLSDLLKLQVDMSRYQLRVELVSKVSESAVASVRKLQQNQ